jgi:hypothetical protein
MNSYIDKDFTDSVEYWRDYAKMMEVENAELRKKLDVAVEALKMIALDNTYVGEDGWRDEHFLDVKQATEALKTIEATNE